MRGLNVVGVGKIVNDLRRGYKEYVIERRTYTYLPVVLSIRNYKVYDFVTIFFSEVPAKYLYKYAKRGDFIIFNAYAKTVKYITKKGKNKYILRIFGETASLIYDPSQVKPAWIEEKKKGETNDYKKN